MRELKVIVPIETIKNKKNHDQRISLSIFVYSPLIDQYFRLSGFYFTNTFYKDDVIEIYYPKDI